LALPLSLAFPILNRYIHRRKTSSSIVTTKGFMKTKYPIEHYVDTLEDQSTIPGKIADGIRKTVEDFAERFDNLDEAKASLKPQSGKWSRK
jgi:hypothetical protein